jgi:hypothetical protein
LLLGNLKQHLPETDSRFSRDELDAFARSAITQDCVNAVQRKALSLFEKGSESDVLTARGLLLALDIFNKQLRVQANEQAREEE